MSAAENTLQQKDVINIDGSKEIVNWLQEQNVSIVFSSYQLGKFFLIGRHPPAGLSVYQRNFNRCMGIAIDPHEDAIFLSSLYQIWKFKNSLPTGDDYQGYDRIYTPQASFLTGDIDVHDMDLTVDGQLVFVNTLFSCLSTHSENYSFEVYWKPKFITKLAPEDRCHLNGVAMENGIPRYVSLFAQTNSPNAWRDHKETGGTIIDILSDEVVCKDLSMPHSPRVYRNKLWILNSGTGHFGYVDLNTGKFHDILFCPGYLRGLKFVNDYAIVGISKLREASVITASTLTENLNKYHESAQCGILIINLQTGQVEHSLKLSGSLIEIYDVGILQNVFKPMAIGIENDGIRRVITIPATKELFEKDTLVILDHLRQ